MEKLDVAEKNNIIRLETERILKEADSIYGFEKGKEVLKNYASYISMKKKEGIDFGNYNILIRNRSSYDSAQKVVDVIWKLLKSENVINTPYKYLTREDIRKRLTTNEFEAMKKVEEELVVIDTKMDMPIYRITNDLKQIMEQFSEKIFILIDEERMEGEISANFGDLITWNMNVERISKEDKEDFIQKFLLSNEIQVEENCPFIDRLSEEPFWKVKEELYNMVLKLKVEKIELITNQVVKEVLKRDYYDEKCKKQTTKKKGLEELEELIGMEAVKSQVKQILNYIRVNKNRGKMPALHMCFRGNPGTGKTTIARIIGKIFQEEEILSNSGRFIEAQRSDLIGEYVGQTAPKTKKMIDRAKGGILFIDEAYSISPKGSKIDYGHECIATLIKEMEDNRDNLCVILAGYTNEMEEMLKVNPGFESRIQFKVDFPDYSAEELYEIFKQMAKSEKYKLSSNLKNTLIELFEEERKKDNFANARVVRNIFEKVKFEQADRVINQKEKDVNLIKKIDIEKVSQKMEKPEVTKYKIGFAC